jgi:hypothetical protein
MARPCRRGRVRGARRFLGEHWKSRRPAFPIGGRWPIARGYQGEGPQAVRLGATWRRGDPSSHDGAWPFVHSAMARGGESRHIDVVFADEGLDLPGAPASVLVSGRVASHRADVI